MSHAGLLLLAAVDWPEAATWRWIAAALLLALALWQTLPNGRTPGVVRRSIIAISGILGLVLLWLFLPPMGHLTVQAAFAGFATLTLFAAVATISSRSPVYSAIWFALTLFGTAGLFLLQGAQFLGVATVAVYAGAIVVTFLFVLMLAQPEGHAFYDRISWGTTPRFVGAVTAVLFAMIVAMAVATPDEDVLADRDAARAEMQEAVAATLPSATVRTHQFLADEPGTLARVLIAVPPSDRDQFDAVRTQLESALLPIQQRRYPQWTVDRVQLVAEDVRATNHAASLGGQLFTRHLLAVQGAGALLMAALVGAVAIAGRGGALDQ